LLKPADLEAHLSAFAWAVAHPGAVRETELTARHKDGTWRVLGCSTVGRLHQPAVGAVVCNYRDVSRRRSAEDGARAAARQFSEIFGNSPTAMFIYDSVDGRITDANARFERLSEHTRQEILGRSSADLGLWAADSAALMLPGAELVQDQDARMVSRSGAQLDVSLSVERLDRRDRANPLRVAVITDVTEKHVLEAQHRHSQKMDAIGQLAGGVAHDFNNLLTIIVGYAEILAARADLSAGALRDVGEIAKAGETAATLTKQLLTFSRRSVIERGVIDVNALVTTTYGLLARLIGDDIEMVVRLAPSVQAVLADAAQIEQCVMNLAVNARDAMPSGGRLVIETADVELDAAFVRAHAGSREGKHVMIAVSDTGVGMDDAVRARAFEPFFTTKPHGKGTGLGLSTVYGALKQSHGFVVVESEPGQGSTFRIYLPATDEAVDVVPPASTGDERRRSEAILLVEDEEGVRELVQRVLRERGYVVTVAASSTEAVQILSGDGGPFDLLLTDLVMPVIGGREVARICHDRCRDVRVLYMSGNADGLVQDGALQPGLALIQKPFAGPALLDRVRAVLDAPLAPTI
jgi:PAS domain S-box-containing protein